jgi:hypothetical protein
VCNRLYRLQSSVLVCNRPATATITGIPYVYAAPALAVLAILTALATLNILITLAALATFAISTILAITMFRFVNSAYAGRIEGLN